MRAEYGSRIKNLSQDPDPPENILGLQWTLRLVEHGQVTPPPANLTVYAHDP